MLAQMIATLDSTPAGVARRLRYKSAFSVAVFWSPKFLATHSASLPLISGAEDIVLVVYWFCTPPHPPPISAKM